MEKTFSEIPRLKEKICKKSSKAIFNDTHVQRINGSRNVKCKNGEKSLKNVFKKVKCFKVRSDWRAFKKYFFNIHILKVKSPWKMILKYSRLRNPI